MRLLSSVASFSFPCRFQGPNMNMSRILLLLSVAAVAQAESLQNGMLTLTFYSTVLKQHVDPHGQTCTHQY